MASSLPRDIAPAFPEDVAPDQVRAKLRELLGLDELPADVDFAVKDKADEDDLTVTRVIYGNSLGEKRDAGILSPAGAALPGVVCMHGTGGAIERVVGAELRLEAPGRQLLGWGRALARRGYATISISLKDSVVRRGAVEAAWCAMSCDPWVAAAAAICGGLGRLARVIHDGDVDRHSSLIYIPHLLRYFDHPQIAAHCIAPRPFMHVGPTGDVDMPRAGVDEMTAVVSKAYREAGCADRFKVYQPPGNHVFEIAYYEWMVAWFEEFLGRGRAAK